MGQILNSNYHYAAYFLPILSRIIPYFDLLCGISSPYLPNLGLYTELAP